MKKKLVVDPSESVNNDTEKERLPLTSVFYLCYREEKKYKEDQADKTFQGTD